MTTIDLTELIPRCHEASKANGWWEPRPNAGQQLMLVVSELSEALEADRTGRACNMQRYVGKCAALHRAFCPDAFREHIKDSAPDELADAYIRLCDFAGGFGLCIKALSFDPILLMPDNFGEFLLGVTAAVVMVEYQANHRERGVSVALSQLAAWCAREGIDLATHIDLKLQYNATRGHKHGGKAY